MSRRRARCVQRGITGGGTQYQCATGLYHLGGLFTLRARNLPARGADRVRPKGRTGHRRGRRSILARGNRGRGSRRRR